MAEGKKQRVETKRRKPKSTFHEVVSAAKKVERRTKRPASEATVRAELGGGSPNYVCRMLAEWRASKKFDGLKPRRTSDPSAETSKQDHHDEPHPEPPEDAFRPSPGKENEEAIAVSGLARGTADMTLGALTGRLDRLQALVWRQVVDIRLLTSDVRELGRRVDALSGMAVAETRQKPLAPSEATTAGSRRPMSGKDAPKPVEASSPDRSIDDATIRKQVRVAIFHCVANLVQVGSPMSSEQLHRLLPEDAQVGTRDDLYQYLKIRARKGNLIRYAGGRSGAFEAGPEAPAFLDRHQQKPVVNLTRTQVARAETDTVFLGALELLEKAGGPLPADEIVYALSDGSKEGMKRVKDLLKNCHYRLRRDARGRGISRIDVGEGDRKTEAGPRYLHVLTYHEEA